MGDLKNIAKELRKGRHNIEREIKKGIKRITPSAKKYLKENSREIAKALWDLAQNIMAGGNGFEEFYEKLKVKIDEL